MNQIVSISHQPTTVGSKIVVNPSITTKRSTAAKRLVNMNRTGFVGDFFI